jgi:hypothetical protein
MLTALLFLGLMVSAAQPDAHEPINPLYKELREKGVPFSDHTRLPLPAPVMPDGLDAVAQKAVLRKLLGDDIDYEAFLEAREFAPHLYLPLREIAGGNPDAPARMMELYFVAHGKFSVLTKKDVLERLGAADRNKGEAKTLPAEELKKRGIAIGPEMAKREGYGHARYNLLDKVELDVTGHSIWSETADSLVLAAEVDPRFATDKEYANQWRALEKTDEGDFKKGPPHPYQGAGYYMKITRLKNPAGALFVECHVLFAEPTQWFQGTNLLRSKLPPIAQDLARKFRKELIKASKED